MFIVLLYRQFANHISILTGQGINRRSNIVSSGFGLGIEVLDPPSGSDIGRAEAIYYAVKLHDGDDDAPNGSLKAVSRV
jgi:hypothetical protein